MPTVELVELPSINLAETLQSVTEEEEVNDVVSEFTELPVYPREAILLPRCVLLRMLNQLSITPRTKTTNHSFASSYATKSIHLLTVKSQ